MENLSEYVYITQKERGALFPQILLNVTLCFGSVLYGQIFNWATAFSKHSHDLEYTEMINDPYSWIACIGPLGISVGTLTWGFLTRRLGPKRTLLLQTPIMIFSRVLMSFCNKFQVYWTAHFLAAFCAASYIYTGEIYLVDCLHRRNLKFFYIFFYSSTKLGILSLNAIALNCTKLSSCIITGIIAILYFALIMTLPDSPQYLIQRNEYEAASSLKYYLGKNRISAELNIVRQNMNFLNFGSYSHTQMLSSKVVMRAIIIIITLNVFKTCTGYHAFILDGIRLFRNTTPYSSPYGDNLIHSAILFVCTLIGSFINLYGNFGIKVPMTISLFLSSIMLSTFGVINFLTEERKFVPSPGTVLLILTIFSFSYEIGVNMCIPKMIYSYIPCQIYDLCYKHMCVAEWFIIFAFVKTYMECKEKFGLYIVLWFLSGISLIGSIFVVVCVVDIKGKSLMTIQMELGGNPIGNRGSTRQRKGNPFETEEERHYLEKLVAADIASPIVLFKK